MKQGKKFIFPENVESSYGVIMGLTLKELILYVAPFFIFGMVIIALPPHSIAYMLIKIMVVLLAITILLAILVARPVKSRPNIRYSQFLRQRKSYKTRQKLFYTEPKKKNPF